jgi:hypothetical protein
MVSSTNKNSLNQVTIENFTTPVKFLIFFYVKLVSQVSLVRSWCAQRQLQFYYTRTGGKNSFGG